MAKRRNLWLCAGGIHLLLVFLVSLRDTAGLLSQGENILPRSLDFSWSQLTGIASGAVGERLDPANPLRRAAALYLHVAGIEAGYAFFSPNVPSTYKLVFQLHYPDGRIAYLLPEIRSRATGLRLVSLYDYIGRVEYPPLRELMFRMLARSAHRTHPQANRIRTVFGLVDVGSPAAFEQGARESYDALYVYDFQFPEKPRRASKPAP
jgi:hypothetical protein